MEGDYKGGAFCRNQEVGVLLDELCNNTEAVSENSGSSTTAGDLQTDKFVLKDLIPPPKPRNTAPPPVNCALPFSPQPLRILHPKFGGHVSFRTFREAALCVLLMDSVPLLDFVRWATTLKAQIERDPICVPKNELWRFLLLHDHSLPSLKAPTKPMENNNIPTESENNRNNGTPAVPSTTLSPTVLRNQMRSFERIVKEDNAEPFWEENQRPRKTSRNSSDSNEEETDVIRRKLRRHGR